MASAHYHRSKTVRHALQRVFQRATKLAESATNGDLAGRCLTNSFALQRALESLGYDGIVIRGVVREDCSRTEPTAQSIPTEGGYSHWWTEATIEGQYFTLDLHSLHPDREGQPLAIGDRPPEYIPYELEPSYPSVEQRIPPVNEVVK